MQSKYETEIATLKRRLQQRKPADAVQLRKTISRLSSDLAQTQQKLKDADKFRERALREPPICTDLVGNTLQNIREIQLQKKLILQ